MVIIRIKWGNPCKISLAHVEHLLRAHKSYLLFSLGVPSHSLDYFCFPKLLGKEVVQTAANGNSCHLVWSGGSMCVSVFHFLREPFPLWAEQGEICRQRNNSGRAQSHSQKSLPRSQWLAPPTPVWKWPLERELWLPWWPRAKDQRAQNRGPTGGFQTWAGWLLERPFKMQGFPEPVTLTWLLGESPETTSRPASPLTCSVQGLWPPCPPEIIVDQRTVLPCHPW